MTTVLQCGMIEVVRARADKNRRCTFSGCGRPLKALGLCTGHHRQHLRGLELRSLRTGPALVLLPGVRVSPDCAAALGERAGLKAREVLEAWAKRQRGKRG